MACLDNGSTRFPYIYPMKPPFKKVLLDTQERTAVDAFEIDSCKAGAGGKGAWQVRKITLRGGTQEGVDLVEIENGKLSFSVLPTRGMSILEGSSEGVRLGWDSPVKDPVHPASINLHDRGGLGWLKGFNEWIVRCGLSSIGAPGVDAMVDNTGNPAEEHLTLHGKIANTPARKVSLEITEEEIILRGEVDETMLFGPALRLNTEIRTKFDSGLLEIRDTVTNIGATPTDHQLLYHVNYGSPLLAKGTRLVCPFKVLAPRDARAAEGIATFDEYEGPVEGFVEQAYFLELAGKPSTGATAVMLRNAEGDTASVLRYAVDHFPSFTLWKNTAAREDGYVTGLEPATSFPSARGFERSKGRVVRLKGGESRSTTLTVELLSTREAVRAVEAEIEELQGSVDPERHPEPIDRFSNI
mgnify:CR=1 FL=1